MDADVKIVFKLQESFLTLVYHQTIDRGSNTCEVVDKFTVVATDS